MYDFPSIRKAALLLDIDKRNIQTSLNYMTYHKSDVLGEYVRYTSIPEKRDENFNKVGE